MQGYPREYYEDRHRRTVYSADTVLSIVLEHVPAIQSAVDVGCGVGTWLSVLRGKGVTEIAGIDGGWVDQDLLVIPRERFHEVDLSRTAAKLPRRYDLAICLEVAEHLSADLADEFVASLTALSDHVLFSAAVPFQGGEHHVNEQWQHYWVEKFAALEYQAHDFIRPRIWTDERIPFWYRQNILLFSKRPPTALGGEPPAPLDLVHPRLYLSKVAEQTGVRSSFGVFVRELGDYLARKLGRNR